MRAERRFLSAIACALLVLGSTAPRAQEHRLKAFDEVLDLYVRDGEVYYRALKSDRAKIDGFVASIATQAVDKLSREERLAFWLNAYDALVLQTVINNYPIVKRSAAYPANSIRQIPGAFERLPHRVAGRSLTLDQIEQTILPEFQDPRVYLALGRGAQGSGRLRSEAFSAERIETQLDEAASECATHAQCLHINREADTIGVSSVFSWREKEFVAAYAAKASETFAARSPLERAVLAFIQPKLLSIEKEALEKNTFKVTFIPFDWALNDLTGRGGR
jgi:uncharacterized protein DUF547